MVPFGSLYSLFPSTFLLFFVPFCVTGLSFLGTVLLGPKPLRLFFLLSFPFHESLNPAPLQPPGPGTPLPDRPTLSLPSGRSHAEVFRPFLYTVPPYTTALNPPSLFFHLCPHHYTSLLILPEFFPSPDMTGPITSGVIRPLHQP